MEPIISLFFLPADDGDREVLFTAVFVEIRETRIDTAILSSETLFQQKLHHRREIKRYLRSKYSAQASSQLMWTAAHISDKPCLNTLLAYIHLLL